MRHGSHQLPHRGQAFRAIQLVFRIDQLRIGLQEFFSLPGESCTRRLLSGLSFFPSHANIGYDQEHSCDHTAIDHRRLKPSRFGRLHQPHIGCHDTGHHRQKHQDATAQCCNQQNRQHKTVCADNVCWGGHFENDDRQEHRPCDRQHNAILFQHRNGRLAGC